MTRIISKGVNVSVTGALEAQIQELFGSVADNFENFIVEDIQVTIESQLKQSTEVHSVKARIPIKGNDIFSDSSGSDMYHAISEAASSATRQLRKLKGRVNNNKGFDKRQEIIED
jgi:ribosomal subunit interface protein